MWVRGTESDSPCFSWGEIRGRWPSGCHCYRDRNRGKGSEETAASKQFECYLALQIATATQDNRGCFVADFVTYLSEKTFFFWCHYKQRQKLKRTAAALEQRVLMLNLAYQKKKRFLDMFTAPCERWQHQLSALFWVTLNCFWMDSCED